MRGDISYLAGVLKVISHEMLYREQVLVLGVIQQLGNSHLFRPVEVVLGLACMEMEFITQSQEELAGLVQAFPVLARDVTLPHQLFGRGLPVADKADPADQLDVTQSSSRSLDIRLEQVNRASPLLLLLTASLRDCQDG